MAGQSNIEVVKVKPRGVRPHLREHLSVTRLAVATLCVCVPPRQESVMPTISVERDLLFKTLGKTYSE